MNAASRPAVKRASSLKYQMSQRLIGATLLCSFAMAIESRAQQLRWESVGVRSGFSATSIDDGFHQAEAFLVWDLPWSWQLGSSWRVQSQLDLSAGVLDGSGADGFVGTAGLRLVLTRGHFPVAFEAGVSPTILSHDQFGDVDFGVPLQFTSHAGFTWDIGSRFRVGYRFQHMSNAGLHFLNPGLDLHMLGISYRF